MTKQTTKKRTAQKNAGQNGLNQKGNSKQKAATMLVTRKRTPAKKKRRLMFSSVKATRRTLSRLTRDFYEGRLSENKLKNITYSARAIMGGFKLENEIASEEQIREIKRMIEKLQGPGIETKTA